jgi:thymidylate synthase
MRKFSDDGYILSGAYGPRLHPQWEYIIKSLKESSESRQAVSTIWTPSPLNSKDIPCTISMQWLIRKGLLHCTVNMRSSDVWLGIPYDFFSFSQVTNVLSATVGVPVGSITMNLASSHLYLNNEKAALEAISEPGITCIRSPQLKYPLDRAGMVSILDQNAYLKVPLRGFGLVTL